MRRDNAKYYAKDSNLIFFDIAPMEYKGWNEYQSGVKKLLADYSSFKLIPADDLQVTQRGNVTWTVLTFRIAAKKKDGTPVEMDCRHTAI